MSLESSYLNDPHWEPSISIWYKIWCPFCETPNWFARDTKYNIDGIDCWDCHSLFWTMSQTNREDNYGQYLEIDDDEYQYKDYDEILKEVAYIAKGQQKPRI